MIRINLAKPASAGGPNLGATMAGIDTGSAEIRREGGIRFFILLLIPLAMKGYEFQQIPGLQDQVAARTKILQALTEKNTKAEAAVSEIKRYKEDQAKLQKQIDILEGLQAERLLEVKILDNVQKDIPNKVWLSKIELQEGKFAVVGQTTTDSDLTLFMENLGKSIFLKEVNLIKSEEVPTDKGTLKKFDIQCAVDKPVAGVKK